MDSYKNLLEKYKKLPDTASIDSFSKEDKTKMKGYMHSLGIPAQTKILKKLREKYKTSK